MSANSETLQFLFQMPSKTPGVSSEDQYQTSNSYQPSNSTSYQPTNSSSYQPTNNTSYQSPSAATNQKLNSSFPNIPRQVNSSYQNIPGSTGAGGYGSSQVGMNEPPYQDYRQTNAVVHSTPEPQARPQQG